MASPFPATLRKKEEDRFVVKSLISPKLQGKEATMDYAEDCAGISVKEKARSKA